MLKPQDIVVLCWVLTQERMPWFHDPYGDSQGISEAETNSARFYKKWLSYSDLASALSMSPSSAHGAARRLLSAGLLRPRERHDDERWIAPWVVNGPAAAEFLIHGVKYFCYAERGPVTRGIPTGIAGSSLRNEFSIGEEFPVWPDPEGSARGYALKPLYPSVPIAAKFNAPLNEVLALIDAIRDGRARERSAAEKQLRIYLKQDSG